MTLHDELREKIDAVSDWSQIGKVFLEMKFRFLVYAPFIVKCTNTGHFLHSYEGAQTMNDRIRKIQESEYDSNVTQKPISLNELTSIPMQHLTRYGLQLNGMAKTAFKKLNSDKFEEGEDKEAIKEFATHIEKAAFAMVRS